jgi:hypothetical protein
MIHTDYHNTAMQLVSEIPRSTLGMTRLSPWRDDGYHRRGDDRTETTTQRLSTSD